MDSAMNWRALLASLVGCCALVPLRVIGILYLGEISLAVVCCAVLLTRIGVGSFWSSPARRLLVLLCVALAGYVIADTVRSSSSENYLRGWSRLAFIGTNFIGMYYLTRKNRIAWPFFFLSFAVGSLVVIYVTNEYLNNFEANWKFGFATPVTMIWLCVLAAFGKHGIRPAAFGLALIGFINVYFDYRSMGLICVVVAAIILASTRSRAGSLKVNSRVLLITAALSVVVITSGYVMTQDEYGLRRLGSNSWRRGSMLATVKGIMRSPIIGNGSMATDYEVEGWHEEGMQNRSVVRSFLGKNDVFSPHSQVLQAWYEGGILGVLFFIYYGFLLIKTLTLLVKRKVDHLSGLCLFMILQLLWALVFSPLAGDQRIFVAAGMALICFLQDEKRTLPAGAAFLPLSSSKMRRERVPVPSSPLIRSSDKWK